MFGDPLSENSYYKKISILDACDNITGGGTPSKKHPEYYEGNIPWVSPKDMNTSIIEDSQDHITEEAITKSTTKLIPEQSVLMVIRSGVLKHDLPIAINKVPVTINQDMKAFLVGSKIIPQYLFGYFKTIEADVLRGVRAVTADNIEFKVFQERLIQIPPMGEQKKFAEFMIQTDKSKFISFKSQFIEMFGDPDNNSKNWPLVSLKDCLVAIDSGKSITCENYPRTGDLPAILKLSAVTYGEYQPEENKQLPLAEQFIKEAEVHVGDLLFSRKNTLEYVGMTALVKQTPPKLMMPDLIFRLVPQENVRPQYLHQLINHPMYRGTISGLANGSAGSMPNISKQKLNTLAIPLPPVELQMEIEPFIEQSDKSK